MVKLKCMDQNEKKNQNIGTKSAFMPLTFIDTILSRWWPICEEASK